MDSLKDEIDTEQSKQRTYDQRISELNEKLRNAENTASTTSDQLVHESTSRQVLNNTKVQHSTIDIIFLEIQYLEEIS